jgi:uncharacterized protein YndB with AHSA1/START domain
LVFAYYIAAPAEEVWDGFVPKEANQKIFAGADFEVDLRPGGAKTWSGSDHNGNPTMMPSEYWVARPRRLI